MKKILSLLVSLLTAFAASAGYTIFNSGGIRYQLDEDTWTLTVINDGTEACYSGDVKIPASVFYVDNTYPVTAIGDEAFYKCVELTSISIPNSVETIGNRAFLGCKKLKSIILPGVTTIGEQAFRGCSLMGGVKFGESLTTIGDYAFLECLSLTWMSLPESVTELGHGAFKSCNALTQANIPSGLQKAGVGVFSCCKQLKAFYGSHISSDNRCFIFNGVLNTLAHADLTTYSIPETVKTIGTDAIGGAALTTIEIPSSVTVIDNSAFYLCEKLQTVTIPESVQQLGGHVFLGCTALEAIYGKFTSADHRSLIFDGVLNSVASVNCESYTVPDGVTEIGVQACCYAKFKNVNIPGSVTTINYSAFSHSKIENVTIPASVTLIGNDTFAECYSLQSVTLEGTNPPTLRGNYVFGQSGVHNATLWVPQGCVETYKAADEQWGQFGSYAELPFQFSESNEAGIPIYYNINKNGYQVTVTYSTDAYNSYSGDVVIPKEVVHDGKTYGVNKIGDYAFYGSTGLTSVTIPEGVISTGVASFRNCSVLTEVNFPSTIYQIGDYSFLGTGLKSLVVPDYVSSIKSHAFSDCPNLTSVQIPARCLNIEEQAFAWCPLKKVTIEVRNPAHITMGANVFYDSFKDSSVYLEVPKDSKASYEEAAQWSAFKSAGGVKELGYHLRANNDGIPMYYTVNDGDADVSLSYRYDNEKSYSSDIVVPESIKDAVTGKSYTVTAIGDKAFYSCTNLQSVEIPETVSSIGDYAFWACTALHSINLPSAVTTIGEHGFHGCSTLSSITLGENMESIGALAFAFCPSIKSMTVKTVDPTDIKMGEAVFANSNTSTSTLYVPKGSEAAYGSADQWKDFGTRIEGVDFSGIEDVVASPVRPADNVYYDLQGRRVANPTRGLYILNGRKVLVK